MLRNQSFYVSVQLSLKFILCLLGRYIKYFSVILCAAFQVVTKGGTAVSNLSIYGSKQFIVLLVVRAAI